MKKWPWIIYGSLLTTSSFGGLRDLLSNDSSIRTYYTILLAFDKHYALFLGLNVISALLGFLASLIVFLYAFNIKSSVLFWRWLLVIRLLFDLTGHHYDLQFIKSAFFQSLPYGLACVGVFIIPIVPSYIAHYLYAFKNPVKK